MDIVYPTQKTSVMDAAGRIRDLNPEQHWAADDPLVIAYPDLFSTEPVKVYTSERGWAPVESATAAPGEVRNVRRK